MSTNKRKSKLFALVLHCVLLSSVWSLSVAFGRPFLSGMIENNVLFQFIWSGVIQNLIWVVPAILLIHHFKSDVYVSLKEMFTSKVKYLLIFVVLTVAATLAIIFLLKGEIEHSSRFGINRLIAVLFVALAEEIVFRGWMLNAIYREDKKWICFLINAVMAFVIYIPIWFLIGNFKLTLITYKIVESFISSFISSVLFGWIFVKSRNIFVPITLHMLLSLLLYVINLLTFSVLR